jgi:hypothetical protein
MGGLLVVERDLYWRRQVKAAPENEGTMQRMEGIDSVSE